MNILTFIFVSFIINLIHTKTIFSLVIRNIEKKHSLYDKLKQIDNTRKIQIECDSKDIKSTHNARIIDISSCDSNELSHLDLPMLINNSLFIIIILVEINEPDFDFTHYQRAFSELLKVNTRALLIDFYNEYDDNEEIQVIEANQVYIEQALLSSSNNYLKSIKSAMINKCNLCLRIIQLTNEIPEFDLSEFVVDNIKCNTDCFRALLDLPFHFEFDGTQADVYHTLHHSHIKNMKNSRRNAQNIDEYYYFYEDFMSNKLNGTLCDLLTTLAWKTKMFDIFYFLIRADCAYPQDFLDERLNSFDYPSENKFVLRVEDYIEKIEKFHNVIKNGNLNSVETFVNANSGLIFARNLSRKTALKAAFDSENLKIFSYLKSMGFFFDNYSEIADYYRVKNKFSKKKKEMTRQYNKMFTKPAQNDVIQKLIDHSLVRYDAKVYTNDRIISELRKIFIDLNEFISETLVVAAASNQLEIIFDFENSNLDDFDPTKSRAHGVVYTPNDCIAIAGLHLIDSEDDKRDYALGTPAHELFHYVIQQIYDNDFCPFKKNDERRRKKFDKIFKATQLVKHKDELIESAFRNGSTQNYQYGELIARVPDILLTHRRNLTYINECKINFKDLFNYYENEVVKDLQEMIPIIEVRERVKEFNEWFNVIAEIEDDESKRKKDDSEYENYDDDNEKKIIDDIKYRINVLYSNNPKRKLAQIYKEINLMKILTIFVKSSFGKNKNFEKVMNKIDTLHPEILIIIDCDDTEGLISFDNILDIVTFEKIIVVADDKYSKNIEKIPFFEEWEVY